MIDKVYVCNKCGTGYSNRPLYDKCTSCGESIKEISMTEEDLTIATNNGLIKITENYANAISKLGDTFYIKWVLKDDIKTLYQGLGITNVKNITLYIPKPKNIFKLFFKWIKHWWNNNGYEYIFFRITVDINNKKVIVDSNKINNKWRITQMTEAEL